MHTRGISFEKVVNSVIPVADASISEDSVMYAQLDFQRRWHKDLSGLSLLLKPPRVIPRPTKAGADP